MQYYAGLTLATDVLAIYLNRLTVADTMDETDEIDDVGGSSYTDDDEEDILNELLSTSLTANVGLMLILTSCYCCNS